MSRLDFGIAIEQYPFCLVLSPVHPQMECHPGNPQNHYHLGGDKVPEAVEA
jgi:hypothetical protein